MKKQIAFFILGVIIISLSTPLAYSAIDIIYANRNLTGEYVPLLNGFIHSFMLIGILIFSLGLVKLFRDKDIN